MEQSHFREANSPFISAEIPRILLNRLWPCSQEDLALLYTDKRRAKCLCNQHFGEHRT